MANLLKADGSNRPLSPATPPYFTLEELQAAVGGYIEIIPIDRTTLLIVNEEGRLHGLPRNSQASDLMHQLKFDPTGGLGVLGDAVLIPRSQIDTR